MMGMVYTYINVDAKVMGLLTRGHHAQSRDMDMDVIPLQCQRLMSIMIVS